MPDSHLDLQTVLDRADALVPEVEAWVTRGDPAEVAVPAVAVAFAWRATSTAARGVEAPDRPILLAGFWQTPIECPLLDAAAGVILARARLAPVLADADKWSQAELLSNAHGTLERSLFNPGRDQLRGLVRALERELWRVAKALPQLTATPVEQPVPAELTLNSLAVGLRDAGGAALAAAAVAPAMSVRPDNGSWANLVNRYYA